MKRKALKPIQTRDAWVRYFQARIAAAFSDLFAPLVRGFNADEKDNAKDSALLSALRRGDVRYRSGAFYGHFNAAISRELKEMGGVFKGGAWVVSADRLPASVLYAATRAENMLRRMQERIDDQITALVERVPGYVKKLDFTEEFSKIEGGVERGFRETVTKELGVAPTITPTMAERLRVEYTENIKLSISGFAQDDAEALRKGLQKLVYEGAPRADVMAFIGAKLNVTKERAKYIARQETALFTSKLKESQYRGAGIDEYRWSTVGDNRVRNRHKALNNKIFKWDDPPVVDVDTGKRGHPGEDYNCRCQAIPLVTRL